MNVILFIVLFYYQAVSVLVPVSQVCDFIDEEVLIIDVRTPEEFEQGALQNAKNISVSSLEFSLLISKLPKEEKVLLYCKSGTRSARAALAMKALGFDKIHELEGGFLAWEAYHN